jgi:signal transduction histidine kinase
LARQIGVAARAVQLMHDLEDSRARLVLARDEERRRLQRNLHDGLGPTLAGISLAAQAARNLVGSDPGEAERVLGRVVAESRAATEDVRRLAYELHPPVLDRLGLVEALREQCGRLRGRGDGTSAETLAVTIEGPQDLGILPAAVALAAFRIALEAFVNVSRHANARSCALRLTLDEALHVEVIDDGDGMAADAHPGVGISSMRERATELGGRCTISAAPRGGTHVHAILPIPRVSDKAADAQSQTGMISRFAGTSAP